MKGDNEEREMENAECNIEATESCPAECIHVYENGKQIINGDVEMKEFSKEELAKNNGKNGTPALVVYNEKVYDVSKSNSWEDGNHENLHDAGKDLTEELETSTPHEAGLLDKFPIVGILKNN